MFHPRHNDVMAPVFYCARPALHVGKHKPLEARRSFFQQRFVEHYQFIGGPVHRVHSEKTRLTLCGLERYRVDGTSWESFDEETTCVTCLAMLGLSSSTEEET